MPPAPEKPTLTPGSNTGGNDTNIVTSDTTPTIVVQCNAATDKIHLQVGASIKTINCTTSGPNEITLSELSEGTHNVKYSIETAAGNVSAESPELNITIDTTPPAGTVNNPSDQEGDISPALTGTVDDPSTKIEITVNGKKYPATNKGDGTWELPAGAITAPQPPASGSSP